MLLLSVQLTRVTSADREKDLADVDTGDSAVGLAKGTTHSSLQSIGTGARQHLVDANDVVWVGADAHVESFLSGSLDHVPGTSLSAHTILYHSLSSCRSSCSWADVLVGADAGGFESFGAQLLVLVGDEVHAHGELVDICTLAAQVEDADLGVWYTTVEA